MSKYAWQIAALVSLFAVLAVWMPARDAEARQEALSAAQEFYRSCLPPEGFEARVTTSAGSWSCPKHQIVGYGMARH